MEKKKRYDVILTLARDYRWKVGAEVGVFRGETLARLLQAGLKMYAVDLWADVPPGPEIKDMEKGVTNYHKWPLAEFEADVRRLAEQYPGKCTILKMDTVAAAQHVPDGSLDFVFIDACHEEKAVIADIKAWTPKIRSGGMLMGHDRAWPSVQRALKRMCPKYKKGADSTWFIRKDGVKCNGARNR